MRVTGWVTLTTAGALTFVMVMGPSPLPDVQAYRVTALFITLSLMLVIGTGLSEIASAIRSRR